MVSSGAIADVKGVSGFDLAAVGHIHGIGISVIADERPVVRIVVPAQVKEPEIELRAVNHLQPIPWRTVPNVEIAVAGSIRLRARGDRAGAGKPDRAVLKPILVGVAIIEDHSSSREELGTFRELNQPTEESSVAVVSCSRRRTENDIVGRAVESRAPLDVIMNVRTESAQERRRIAKIRDDRVIKRIGHIIVAEVAPAAKLEGTHSAQIPDSADEVQTVGSHVVPAVDSHRTCAQLMVAIGEIERYIPSGESSALPRHAVRLRHREIG